MDNIPPLKPSPDLYWRNRIGDFKRKLEVATAHLNTIDATLAAPTHEKMMQAQLLVDIMATEFGAFDNDLKGWWEGLTHDLKKVNGL